MSRRACETPCGSPAQGESQQYSSTYQRVELWGRDLIEALDTVYRKDARCVLMFISAAYRNKSWTRHERRSALAAALEHPHEYVLPLRFDDTDLEGLPPTISISMRERSTLRR